MIAHPEGKPNLSKQIDIKKQNPLLESLSEALDEYEDLPEPHLNSYQHHILGELLDSLSLKNIIPTLANTHLVYLDVAIDKFSGTHPNQHGESFIQLIERKINFALGDAPGDAGELANCTFRKKALFSSLLRGPTAERYESNITNATTEQISSLDFQWMKQIPVQNGSGTLY